MEDILLLWDGEPVQYWIQELFNPDDGQRLRAVDALRHIARPSQTVPLFLQSLVDRDWRVRALTAHSLYDMAHQEKHLPLLLQTVPALAKSLSDESPEVSLNAAYTLELLGPTAKAALPQLSEVAEHGDDRLRQAVSDAIISISKHLY